jgi:hydrogenase expression/formation protein HypE
MSKATFDKTDAKVSANTVSPSKLSPNTVSPSKLSPNIKLNYPLPLTDHPNVLMAHGSGGRMTAQLIDSLFRTAFDNPDLDTLHDGARLTLPTQRIVMTTDSFVVHPLFFPGGDIGCLAVNGTVNDLAMCGARPLYLSVGFIIEEGLAMDTLWQIVQSMRNAADKANVRIVTGDTKVVERGHGDGLYINTTGIGVLEHQQVIGPAQVRSGDSVLLFGDIGRHGMAVMAQRENLRFNSTLESDCAPLAEVVLALLNAGIDIHCLRDATRGGLAAVLNEIAVASGLQIDCEEAAITVNHDVRSACEILGIDPLHVANEGCFVAMINPTDQQKALSIMQQHNPIATIIGSVQETSIQPTSVQQATSAIVTLRTSIGGQRILDLPTGELLPRIC